MRLAGDTGAGAVFLVGALRGVRRGARGSGVIPLVAADVVVAERPGGAKRGEVGREAPRARRAAQTVAAEVQHGEALGRRRRQATQISREAVRRGAEGLQPSCRRRRKRSRGIADV